MIITPVLRRKHTYLALIASKSGIAGILQKRGRNSAGYSKRRFLFCIMEGEFGGDDWQRVLSYLRKHATPCFMQ